MKFELVKTFVDATVFNFQLYLIKIDAYFKHHGVTSLLWHELQGLIVILWFIVGGGGGNYLLYFTSRLFWAPDLLKLYAEYTMHNSGGFHNKCGPGERFSGNHNVIF